MLVPGALPMIFTGLRLSLQASWTTLVAAELVGAVTGLGQVLNGAAGHLPGDDPGRRWSRGVLRRRDDARLGWFEGRAMPWLK